MSSAMQTFPHPLPPTQAQVKIEEQQIRCILFGMPRLLVFSLILLAIIIAAAIAYNFNVMQWLE